MKQITSPVDILNKDDFERELEELGSLRAKADAINSKLTKSISEKYQENPAYYDSFSQRIRAALDQYKERVISESEYLSKMREIMEDYHTGKSTVTYPKAIQETRDLVCILWGALRCFQQRSRSGSVPGLRRRALSGNQEYHCCA